MKLGEPLTDALKARDCAGDVMAYRNMESHPPIDIALARSSTWFFFFVVVTVNKTLEAKSKPNSLRKKKKKWSATLPASHECEARICRAAQTGPFLTYLIMQKSERLLTTRTVSSLEEMFHLFFLLFCFIPSPPHPFLSVCLWGSGGLVGVAGGDQRMVAPDKQQ